MSFRSRGGGGGGGGGGREERGRNPPSRHLWVGNLPHGISERELADRFIRFGELESMAFQPGRSYAFLNFKHPEDAFAAIESLQGSSLRIEFAKPEKASTGPRTEDIFRHDEQRSATRGSPYVQKDSRMRYESPDTYSKPKMGDRNAEASEVLYIGFPASLQVDEMLLREVFSPFGEISKVTVFPGRSYAFVQFRNLMAACKAKETLQGKLFDNPRVHICFAKSEPSSSSNGRGPSSRSLSPLYRSVDRIESSEGYLQDRNYGNINRIPNARDSQYVAGRDLEDSEDYIFNRNGASRNDGRLRPTHKLPQDMYDYHVSPRDMGSRFRDDPHRFPSRGSVYEEEPWGLPEEDYYNYNQETKRLKRSVQADKQPPRYPLSRGRADFPPKDAFDRNYEAGQLRHKPLNMAIRNEEKSSLREAHEELMGGFSLPSNVPERKRYTPELNRPSLKDWNWEGTIAKGGNPICRAKCFPVGKVMDMMLPEFLDCTARTGLDMLAKHYYQSSKAWVVFFVPGSDADIVFYNEFMHYLEEKQRAAVSKIDDTTTLFLVPPSDFSEEVLKVPGKLSISGVILRLETGDSRTGPVLEQGERKNQDLLNYYGETSSSVAFPHRHSAPLDPYTETQRYSFGSDWPPRDVSVTNIRLPKIDQEHSGFVPGKQPSGVVTRYQPEQLTHLASSMSSQNEPERYVQTPNIPPQLVTPGNQNAHVQQGNNSQEEEEGTDANPQKRLQATLQLAAALLQQIQQAKNS